MPGFKKNLSVSEVVAIQNDIKKEQQEKDNKENNCDLKSKPVPGPGHEVPVPPMKENSLEKPGNEFTMKNKPLYKSEDYFGSKKLEGKVAIITGGDSGIGRSIATLYAREGANVAILYLNEHEDANETCKAVEAEGRKCISISGNIQDQNFCNKAIEKVLEFFGSINILVNNAAFQEHASDIEDLTDIRLEQTFSTNIFGYFYMVKAVLPYMHEGDAIINTGSVTGLRGSKNLLDYSATKGAIHAFTKSLAKNLMPRGIRVNAVAPGPVWTPLNPADKNKEDIIDFGASTHMGRPAQPEELSPAYVFLASQVCSSYISGIILPVTGSVGE